jgi:hypothetical protein
MDRLRQGGKQNADDKSSGNAYDVALENFDTAADAMGLDRIRGR